ncbi:MAG: DNA primase, partial [Chloroflexota bacterium]|nr:DNA primase [Chloroflexota bacterium]
MNAAEEIKQRLDIVQVVGDYVQLSKAGHNFRGLCPFHTEKTPSFFVFPERQTWRCFGCGAGGDLLSFVMKKEGLEFGEALEIMAQKAGVSLPEKRVASPEDRQTPKLYQINEAASQYYHGLLLSSPAAQSAREYVQKRRLTPETIEEFQLGFSPDLWEGTKNHLIELGYHEADLVAAGLLVTKEDRTYDRFRGRLMFPICEGRGRVLGFGARALDDSMPKYLNSSESPVFTKSSILYGINRARSAIREQGKVVIVEGYMDALTAHQHGFRNVVASMGTALTEKQIAILKGMTTHICLSLDADAAGNAATLRGIEICRNMLTEGVRGVRGWLGGSTELSATIDIITLPEGQDPDQVIRENSEEWQRLVDQAQPLTDYLFAVTASKFNLSRPEEKAQLTEQLLPLVAQISDSAVREVYLGKLSTLTGLSERALAGKLAEQKVPSRKPSKSKRKGVEVSSSPLRTGDQLEEHCLALLLNYPGLRNAIGELTA